MSSSTPSHVTPFKRLKFQLIRFIRFVGLLKFADNMRFVYRRLKVRRSNNQYLSEHTGFTPPPKDLAFDAYNHFDWKIYSETGEAHARLFSKAMLEFISSEKPKILEWGCGPGRIIRHMPNAFKPRKSAVFGTDYNHKTINWCSENLKGIEFSSNELSPPLQYESETFDAVYCFSVFTHLSEEVQLSWANEIHRVLKPGGVFICTTHGEGNIHLLSSSEEQARYDAGEVVIQGQYKEGAKWFFAIHPPKFVKEKLLGRFSSVRRMPKTDADQMEQDPWIAIK